MGWPSKTSRKDRSILRMVALFHIFQKNHARTVVLALKANCTILPDRHSTPVTSTIWSNFTHGRLLASVDFPVIINLKAGYLGSPKRRPGALYLKGAFFEGIPADLVCLIPCQATRQPTHAALEEWQNPLCRPSRAIWPTCPHIMLTFVHGCRP